MNRCPHCNNPIGSPFVTVENAAGVDYLLLSCPSCNKVIGAINLR